MKGACLLLSLFALTVPYVRCFADQKEPSGRAVYYRQIPPGLAQKLKVQMDDHKKKLAVAKKDAADVRAAIKGADAKKPETMRKLWVKMHEVGPSAIPVVDESLSSDDAAVRKNAILSLRYISSNGEDSPPELTSADKLIVLLYNRSLFDVDRDVRLSALVGVRKYVYSRQGNVPVEVTDALNEALRDPDPLIEKLSVECVEYIDKMRSGSVPTAAVE